MLVSSTIQTQRSMDHSWAVSDASQIPGGLIVDLQFSIAVNYFDIYLTGVSYMDGKVLLVFRNSYGDFVGRVHTNQFGVPIQLDCISGVLGNILLGAAPDVDTVGFLDLDTHIQINPALISTWVPVYGTSEFSIIDKGELIYSTSLAADINIGAGYGVTISPSGVVAVDDNVLQNIADTRAMTTKSRVSSINNISSPSGCINIQLKGVQSQADSVSVTAKHPGYAVISTSDEFTDLLAPEDIIDKHIRPDQNREQTYQPLDDCYVDIDGSGTITKWSDHRNIDNVATVSVLSGTFENPIEESAWSVLKLNPAYDEVVE